MGTPINLLTFYLPKSARAYLFPQSVKFKTLAAAPLVLTPFVRNQLARKASAVPTSRFPRHAEPRARRTRQRRPPGLHPSAPVGSDDSSDCAGCGGRRGRVSPTKAMPSSRDTVYVCCCSFNVELNHTVISTLNENKPTYINFNVENTNRQNKTHFHRPRPLPLLRTSARPCAPS